MHKSINKTLYQFLFDDADIIEEGLKDWVKEKIGKNTAKVASTIKTILKRTPGFTLKAAVKVMKVTWTCIQDLSSAFIKSTKIMSGKYKEILKPFMKGDKNGVAKVIAELILKNGENVESLLKAESRNFDAIKFLDNVNFFDTSLNNKQILIKDCKVLLANKQKLINEAITPQGIAVVVTHFIKLLKILPGTSNKIDKILDVLNPEAWSTEILTKLVVELINSNKKHNDEKTINEHDAEKIESVITLILNMIFLTLTAITITTVFQPPWLWWIELFLLAVSTPSLIADIGVLFDVFGIEKHSRCVKEFINLSKKYRNETEGYKLVNKQN